MWVACGGKAQEWYGRCVLVQVYLLGIERFPERIFHQAGQAYTECQEETEERRRVEGRERRYGAMKNSKERRGSV